MKIEITGDGKSVTMTKDQCSELAGALSRHKGHLESLKLVELGILILE
jgi:hypothetical protein